MIYYITLYYNDICYELYVGICEGEGGGRREGRGDLGDERTRTNCSGSLVSSLLFWAFNWLNLLINHSSNFLMILHNLEMIYKNVRIYCQIK